MEDALGDRMKGYENISRIYLTRRMPLIIRIDGKAFHNLTKHLDKPFDKNFMNAMHETTRQLCSKIEGCRIGYTQSDEISLLLIDYENINTQSWFDKNLQKIVSISASMSTAIFNGTKDDSITGVAIFDSRCFILPKEEVCNYFIWRQQDATRNSIQMMGHANFSHKQLMNKNSNQIQDMLFLEKEINFNDIPTDQKRGVCAIKEKYMNGDAERTRWIIDNEIPIFTENREYIEKYL